MSDESSAVPEAQGEMFELDMEQAEKLIEGSTPGDASTGKGTSRSRTRVARPIPSGTYSDAEDFAAQIYRLGSGSRIRRLTAFNELGKSPSSSQSRELITNSNKYGLLLGNYNAEFLEPSPEAHAIFGENSGSRAKAKARVDSAILGIETFKSLYDEYKGKPLPSREVMKDFLRDQKVAADWITECVDTFLENAKDVGLSQLYAGANRLLTLDHLLEEVPVTQGVAKLEALPRERVTVVGTSTNSTPPPLGYEDACFYITAIGEEGSPQRKHSDLFFSSIVEPAVQECGLRLIRADQIAQPGIITKQILEHIVYAKLVVADLSFHNPNVFYELAIRHACKKPTVQIIQTGDRIPFDVSPARTIVIDNSDLYTFVPQIESYRSQIANQVRKALEDGQEADNPISVFFPGLQVKVPS